MPSQQTEVRLSWWKSASCWVLPNSHWKTQTYSCCPNSVASSNTSTEFQQHGKTTRTKAAWMLLSSQAPSLSALQNQHPSHPQHWKKEKAKQPPYRKPTGKLYEKNTQANYWNNKMHRVVPGTVLLYELGCLLTTPIANSHGIFLSLGAAKLESLDLYPPATTHS